MQIVNYCSATALNVINKHTISISMFDIDNILLCKLIFDRDHLSQIQVILDKVLEKMNEVD